MTGPRLPARYLALFGSIYAVQGVAVAYLLNYNKAYMIAAGVDGRTVALVQSAVLLTLVLKFLLGPLSDRVSPLGLGHRRPYIVAGLLLQAGGLGALALVDPGHRLGLFAALAVSAVFGLSLYDTSCDGMVVDLTPDGDRSRVQATLMIARALATTGCTWAFGRWLDRTGLGPGRSEGLLWTCAALGLLPLGLTWACPEPARPAEDAASSPRAALRGMGSPRSLALMAFGACYGAIGLGVEFNLPLYYASLGMDQGDVGTLGAVRYLGRAAGALALPTLGRRLGTRGRLILGIAALAAATSGQASVQSRGDAAAWAFGFGLAGGWLDAAFCVLAMEASAPRMAASTFALFMAVANLGVAGDALFVEVLGRLGRNYRAVLGGSGALALALAAFIPPLSRPPKHGERR